ncbi:MAG: GDP-L-fucose synthase, partial [Rhodospirillaceae bacterium]
PEHVFLAAAKVGGILANKTLGGDFIRENLYIQTNVIDISYRTGVKKFIFIGSNCAYPRLSPNPLKEEYLLTGELEPTNLPFAVAKIAGIKMCEAYKNQFGFNALTIMPSSVYGPGDSFNPEESHVITGMMRRFHEAKSRNEGNAAIWGSGEPLREFINSKDLARACIFLMQNQTDLDLINVGTSEEVSIKELAVLIKKVVGFSGDLIFDRSKPDGMQRKLLDSSRIFEMGWRPSITLETGLRELYETFLTSKAARGLSIHVGN